MGQTPEDACGGKGSRPVTIGGSMVIGCQIVGDVVCAPRTDVYSYLARVLAFQDNEHDGYRRFRVQPLFAPRTNARDVHRSQLEPTAATFQGYVCLHCRKGSVR
jgi:hypothetical protein